LQKRKKRTWNKKISYDCRKRVADSRLRIKGRFVTKEQAVALLGNDSNSNDLDKISNSEIKNLLNQKFGGCLSIKKRDSSQDSQDGKDSDHEHDNEHELENDYEHEMKLEQSTSQEAAADIEKDKEFEKGLDKFDDEHLDFKCIDDEVKFEDDTLQGKMLDL